MNETPARPSPYGGPERRASPRLRLLIDNLQAGIEENRHQLEMHAVRITQLEAKLGPSR